MQPVVPVRQGPLESLGRGLMPDFQVSAVNRFDFPLQQRLQPPSVDAQKCVLSAFATLVGTCVWSLAFRRDAPVSGAEVLALRAAIDGGDAIVTTGLVLQELLQGFAGPRARKDIVQRFAALPLLVPDRQD